MHNYYLAGLFGRRSSNQKRNDMNITAGINSTTCRIYHVVVIVYISSFLSQNLFLFKFFTFFFFFFFFCLKGQPATSGKQMLSGVVSAGYSGYWTWKAGPGNKGLRSSSVVADEDVFRRLRADGDPIVCGCCVVVFAG